MAWGDDDWDRCRRCEAAYWEFENSPTACTFHPGHKAGGVWDCCRSGNDYGCTRGPHLLATEDEADAIRSARNERRNQRHGYPDGERRCRRCSGRYRSSENHAAACRYHPGTLKDWDHADAPGCGCAGDFWDCCSYVMATDGDTSHGCIAGWHVEVARADPGPLGRLYEAQRGNEAALLAAYEAKVGPGARERVNRVRRAVEEFLAAVRPYGLRELEQGDEAVLAGPLLGWLIARLGDHQYPSSRRLAVAELVEDPEKRVDLLRIAH